MFLLVIIVMIALPVIYDLVFPFKHPNLQNYFSPGLTFASELEGITQTILHQDGDKVFSELKFEPYAMGPPEHLHVHLAESLSVISGTITAKVDGEVSRYSNGERVILPMGRYHTMYNETKEVVILRSEKPEDYIPVEFAYSLAQVYPLMRKGGGLTLKMFAKICVLDRLFDSVPAGPPAPVFHLVKKVVKPYARLLGVTPYDDRSRPV